MSPISDLPPDPSKAAPDAAPGRQLAQARELQNLSAADVARQLKLSLWQVEALEAGRYDRLPGAVFVRGFIRNYARLVKLDPEALLQSTGDRLPQPAQRPETPPSRDIPFPGADSRRGPAYAVAAAIIVGLLAFYEFYWNEPETVATRPVAEAQAPVAPAEQPQAPPEPQKSQKPPPPQSQKPQPAEPQKAQQVAPQKPPQKPQQVSPAEVATGSEIEPQSGEPRASRPSVTATPAPPRAPPAAEVEPNPDATPRSSERQLIFEFDQESWVEIIDATGRAIFSQLNLAGTVRRVRGLPPLTVVVGNAHGVKLTYDDRPVDLARHTKIDVARLTLE